MSNNSKAQPIELDQFKALIFFGVLACFLAYIFYPTFVWMVDRWDARDSYFGHGFLIPLVTGYWIWKKRSAVAKESGAPSSWFGPLFILAGFALQIIGSILRIYFASGFAFVFIVLGTADILLGRRVLKLLWFPFSFLAMMVPLPLLAISQITIRMKFYVSEVAVALINNIGIQAIREGSYVYMPNAVLLVGDPCSGLRSFLAFLCLGMVFAYESDMNAWKRSILVAVGLPLAILSNIMRVTFLGLVGEIYGQQYTGGTVHDVSGVVIFIFAFLFFMYLKSKLEATPQHASQ